MCPHCFSRKPPGFAATCGRSECQEASFYLNRARNARKGSKERATAFARAASIARKRLP